MGPVQRTKVSLRFRGDTLNPDELTGLLGCAATSSAAQGGTWVTPSGAERPAKTGWWHLQIEPADGCDFNLQIARLFEMLTPDCETWRDLSARYGGNLFVGVFLGSSNEGLSVDPGMAAAIGERGLQLQLDIYGRDD